MTGKTAAPGMHLVKCRTNLTHSVHQSRPSVNDHPPRSQAVQAFGHERGRFGGAFYIEW